MMFQKYLRKLKKNAGATNGEQELSLTQLLTPAFLRQHTRFGSVDELFAAWKIDPLSFRNLSDDDQDRLTRAVTKFPTWKALLQDAGKDFANKQLRK